MMGLMTLFRFALIAALACGLTGTLAAKSNPHQVKSRKVKPKKYKARKIKPQKIKHS